MNETRVFADGYRGIFQKQEDFLECLKSIGRNSFWERRNSKNLSNVTGTVSSMFSGIVTALFSIIFMFYFLTGKEKICGQCSRLVKNYLSPPCQTKVFRAATMLDESFRRYITGQCLEALILGGLCFLGMTVFQLPYSAMIGAFVGLMGLIPVMGAYIGAAVGSVMILSVSPGKAVLFLVFIVVLQQIEGNLIYPRVVGPSVGLPAILVLAVVTVSGSLFGIVGMVLSVPIASAVYRGIQEGMQNREKNRKVSG